MFTTYYIYNYAYILEIISWHHTHSMDIMHKMYMVGRLVSYVAPVLNVTSKHATIQLLFILLLLSILLCTYLLKMGSPMMSCCCKLWSRIDYSVYLCHYNIMRASTANWLFSNKPVSYICCLNYTFSNNMTYFHCSLIVKWFAPKWPHLKHYYSIAPHITAGTVLPL